MPLCRCRPAAALLLLLAAVPAACGDTAAELAEEAAIMQRFRDVMPNGDVFGDHSEAWRPGLDVHHCSWAGVTCNDAGHVIMSTTLASRSAPANTSLASPLLPDLARLQRLTSLHIHVPLTRAVARLPAEWWRPGAFPRITLLSISVPSLARGELPEPPAGALPALDSLVLLLPSLRATLPPSWGASAAVLPRLASLHVEARLFGGLPPQWAGGFRKLRRLNLLGSQPTVPGCTSTEAGEEPLDPAAPAMALPAEWPRGFPQLRALFVWNLRLAGTIPGSWAGFAALTQLSLRGCRLTGTLPKWLLGPVTQLELLALASNCLRGPLPPAWAASKVRGLSLGQNALTGPAFPAAWLEPGSMPGLTFLEVPGNLGLNGTLPSALAWPRLKQLDLSSTGVQGRIPQAWCEAPFVVNRLLTDVFLAGTGVDPALPRCLNRSSMSNVSVHSERGEPVGKVTAAGAAAASARQAQRTRSQHAAAVGALLAALAALTAATAGLAQLRGRRARGQLDRQPLLPARRPGGPECRRLHTGEQQPAELALQQLPGRAARLQALLLSQAPAAGGGLASIELTPMRALSAGFQHRLGSARAAVTAARPAHVPRESALPSSASEAPAVAPSRQWGLATTSLQLEQEELQLVAKANGQLVCLGEGAHAAVYQGNLSGAPVAVKVFELDPGIDSGRIWREAAMLRDCVHERIVPLYGIALRGQVLMLAMELMAGGTLRSALLQPDKQVALRWPAKGRAVAHDVAAALDYLHTECGVLHGDLSSSNVLLDESLSGFIGDLGMARIVSSITLSKAGFTLTHAAPDLLLGQRCTPAADVYSLGILLIELTTGQPVMRRGGWRLPRAPDECSAAVVALIEECTATDAAQRPSAAQVLQRLQADPG